MRSLLQFFSLFGIGALAALTALTAHAQAPANDLFANAITLNGPIVTTAGSNVGATKQFGGGGGGEPSIPGGTLGVFGGASVWWNWTATASGQTTIDTEGSSFNTLLGVWTGPAQNQLTLVGGNDDFEANTWSRIVFDAVAGTTYRIMVDGFRSGPGFGAPAMGNIILQVKGVGGITFLGPTNGTVFTVGDPIPVSVTIDADFPNPPATRVDFFLGGTLFASKTTAPYSAVASNAPAGTNSIYVVAIDSAGTPVQSPVVNVFVQSIGVTLLTPFEDTMFLNTNPVTVTAWAYLPAGSITNVEFFVDGVKFAEDDTAPFSGIWTDLTGGSHRFIAVGRSDTGARYNSQPVNIGVASILMPNASVWKYLDDNSDQGTAWRAPNFDDSAWAGGPAPLGYSDSNGRAPVTTNSFGPDPNAKYTTTYFRRAVMVSNAASFARINLNIERDDGAVVYLNGVELSRFNMPTGEVTSATFAASNAGDDGGTVFSVSVSPSLLLDGVNVFAVEIHQDSGTSSDIWFQMNLQGIPVIIHNLSPLVELTTPTNGAYFLAPSEITLAATASDGDGSVAKVEFFAAGVKIGEDATEPYSAVWNNPPVAAQILTAVATDDQGATSTSAEVPVVVYDAVGTPVAAVTSPADGVVMDGPTNLLVTATANAITGVTNVQFLNNGVPFGEDSTAPYSAAWTAPFGTNILTAMAFDASGGSGTSPGITVVITIPPTNVIAPTVASQSPAAGATVTNLTSITVSFSEYAQNIDASDLLINGVPATSVNASHSRSNYTFTFDEPAYGTVNITWAGDNGITDYGFPTVLPFNGAGPGATWSYSFIDKKVPTIADRTPARGSTVTNLSQISVTFSEPVSGVDAADLLLGGNPALAVSGGGASYTFDVTQPASSGAVNVTWATNHSIFDLALEPNAFVGNNTNATWTFTLDTRITLVQSNSNWKFIKGLAEASSPVNAWRQPDFDDSSWSNAPAPFFFGDPYTNANIRGTLLSDMQSNYTTIFLRQEFTVVSRGAITSVLLNHQTDDGLIAWLNGAEVLRYNVPGGELAYDAVASTAASEPSQSGAAYIVATLTNNAVARLVNGTNILAVQVFNQNLTNSSDFGFNAQLYFFPVDPATVPPRIVEADPAGGDLFYLTNVTMHFTEGVSGVDAADLLVNGVPATGVSSTTNSAYTFNFPQPPYGPVAITWATNDDIVDFDTTPRAFDGTLSSATVNYFLINPSNPKVATQAPPASTTLTGLTSIAVTFTEPVAGVDASDFLISGAPASAVTSADNITYNFAFSQPPFGAVAIRWATSNGITDLESPPNSFDRTRFGGQWNYTLIDPVPSVTLTSPSNNTYVLPPGTATLRATATDNDGTVALVEFFEDAGKLGESTNAPYSLVVSNLSLGRYVFRAVATDNIGLTRTSTPVVFNVVTNLPLTLVRGPYLQIGSPTGGVVRWRTDLVSDGVVYYGTDFANLTNVAIEVTRTNEHIVSIAGLEPETQYFYQVGSSIQSVAGGTNAGGADFWFRTSPLPGTRKPVRFWALGDAGTAGNGSPDRQRSVRDAFYNYASTNGGPADLVLMLGDNAYNSGTDSEHQAAVFDMYPTTLRNKFLWPTLGNHETSQSTTATDFPYLHIFSLPKDGEVGGVPSGTEKYYSFDYANIHFVCLDSMTSGLGTNTAMYRWLEDDLGATTADWIIVFFHHPPYTKGSHDSDAEGDLVQIRQNLVPLMETYGVDLVLSGHSHCLERSFLLDGHYGMSGTITEDMKVDGGDGREDGTGAYRKNADGRGVIYCVAGSSGQATGGPLNHPAHFISLNELGSLVIDVVSNRLEAKFLASTGVIRDYYTIIKQPPPPAPTHLIARAIDASNVWLTWTDSSVDELGYVIERSTDGYNFASVGTNAANVTGALDGGLLANTTYFYRVRAFHDGGESVPSNVASVTTVTAGGVPLAPAALSVSASSGGEAYRSQMVLYWRDRSGNEAGFVVERSEDGSDFLPIGTVGANATLFTDTGLESATPYYYRVRSFNSAGQSAPSNLDGDQTHPQDALILAGEAATFHAGVEGFPLARYQWRFNDATIAGATSEALTITNAHITDEGIYTVQITDPSGRIISNPAWLSVLAPPAIVEHPASRTNVIGSAATFHVVADGTSPLFYQWRRDGTNLPGAIGTQLTIGPVTLADQANYDVLVLNDVSFVTSRVARLVVNLPPLAVADLVTAFHDRPFTFNGSVLLANDGDPDGDPIFFASASTNSTEGGTITQDGQSITYSPPAGFLGNDTFSYLLGDARGAFSPGQVTVWVHDNNAPVLAPVPDYMATVMTPLVISNFATDMDTTNLLTFFLDPGAPTNATIHPDSGAFQWTPTREQAPGTNVISVTVADNGSPSQSDTKSFTVMVNDYLELTAGSMVLNAGENNSVPIDVFSSASLLSLQFDLHFPSDRLTNVTFEALAPELAALSVQMLDSNTAALTFTATAGNTLQGTQQLARLHFETRSGQPSAFAPLNLSSVACARATAGLTPTMLANDGRITIVGAQSMLEAILSNAGQRQLVIYSKPGVTNTIQSRTSLATNAVWSNRNSYTVTNLVRTVQAPSPTAPLIFYRIRH